MRSRVELFAQIRRDARVEDLSIRELARRYGVGRPTVRLALEQAAPPPRKQRVRSAPRLDPFKASIDEMLREDMTAPRKQRHTARRVHTRLLVEHGAAQLSYSTVRNYVRVRRAQIAAEAGQLVDVAFVPQSHQPGAEAEVDFAELAVDLPMGRMKCYLFTLRLSFSGKAVHRVYATQSQEAFLEGHIAAFEELGGVPTTHVRYDNLSSAVTTVIYGTGRRRTENERWVLFQSHYGFDPFYCIPGVEGAHEKGGVEGEDGRFGRNHLVPVPKAASLAELNARLQLIDRAEDARVIAGRMRSVGVDFALEAAQLRALPVERFEPGLLLNPRVDRHSRIMVRNNQYSVPARLIGRRVRVRLRSNELLVFDGPTLIARHDRAVSKAVQFLELDHYLEVLKVKPGALPGATALKQARDACVFTAAHDAFWAESRKVNGDAEGTRELIDVLLLHRSMATAEVIAGINAALTVGAVSADVVAVEARMSATSTGQPCAAAPNATPVTVRSQRVISLTQRRLTDPAAVIAGLPPDTRPLPSVNAYDQLLPSRKPAPQPAPQESAS